MTIGVKISNMTSTGALVAGDVVPVVRSGTNLRYDLGTKLVNLDAAVAGGISAAALAASTGAALVGSTRGTVQSQLDFIYQPDQVAHPATLAYGDGLRLLSGSNVHDTIAIGPGTLTLLTGVSALGNPPGGYGMTFLGTNAGHDATNAYDIIGIGYEVAYRLTEGHTSTIIGAKALYNCTEPYWMNVTGVTAFFTATTAFESGARGTNAGYNATTVRESEVDGFNAGWFLGTIQRCVIKGWKAGGGFTGTAGVGLSQDNNSTGYRAGGSLRNGVENVFDGRDAGVSVRDGNSNTATGAYSLTSAVDTSQNAAHGYNCLRGYTGSGATGIGAGVLQVNLTGVRLNASGFEAGKLATGDDLDLSGYGTAPLLTIGGNVTTAGSRSAVSITTAGQGTFIGSQSDGAATLDNQTALGFQAVTTKANQVKLGNGSVIEVTTDGCIAANNNDAVPAGGSTAIGFKLTSAANLGLFVGSGAPTISAAKGSLYTRTDGSSTSTRMYVNTDGGTTWTNLVTAS